MSRERRRSTFQIAILLSLSLLAALTGWGCFGCGSGSDHLQVQLSTAANGRSLITTDGHVERWHDFWGESRTFTAGELGFLRNWIGGKTVIGLLVPQAPGADEPGSLAAGVAHDASVWFNGWQMDVDLVASEARATQLEAYFPTVPNSHWQVLVPGNDDRKAGLPTETTTFANVSGWLHYTLDYPDTLPHACDTVIADRAGSHV